MAKTNLPARAEFNSVGYSGKALPKKLGIKPGTVVVLVRAPDAFEQTLGELPTDVTVRHRNQGPDTLVHSITSRATRRN